MKSYFQSLNISNKIGISLVLFYFLVATDASYTTLTNLNKILVMPLNNLETPKIILPLLIGNSNIVIWTLIIFSFLVPWLCFRFTESNLLRALNAVVFIVAKGVIGGQFRLNHSYWPMMWVLIFMAIPKDVTVDLNQSKILKTCYRASVLAITMFYFSSAVWKLFAGIENLDLFNSNYEANTIAFYLVSHGKTGALSDLMISNPLLAFIGFWIILILHLSGPLCLVSLRYLRTWPYLILIFHLMSLLIVDINFFLAGISAVAILAMAPAEIIFKTRSLLNRIGLNANS